MRSLRRRPANRIGPQPLPRGITSLYNSESTLNLRPLFGQPLNAHRDGTPRTPWELRAMIAVILGPANLRPVSASHQHQQDRPQGLHKRRRRIWRKKPALPQASSSFPPQHHQIWAVGSANERERSGNRRLSMQACWQTHSDVNSDKINTKTVYTSLLVAKKGWAFIGFIGFIAN